MAPQERLNNAIFTLENTAIFTLDILKADNQI